MNLMNQDLSANVFVNVMASDDPKVIDSQGGVNLELEVVTILTSFIMCLLLEVINYLDDWSGWSRLGFRFSDLKTCWKVKMNAFERLVNTGCLTFKWTNLGFQNHTRGLMFKRTHLVVQRNMGCSIFDETHMDVRMNIRVVGTEARSCSNEHEMFKWTCAVLLSLLCVLIKCLEQLKDVRLDQTITAAFQITCIDT